MPKPESLAPNEAAVAGACRDLLNGARGRKDRADSDDVTQDACLLALQMPRPDRIRDPIRYVFRIARNVFIDRQRQKARETALVQPLGDIHAEIRDDFDPERALAAKQTLSRVLAAIGSLPPRCREAFTLNRFEGMSYGAIARRMKISTSMVEKHIAEAVLRLGRTLREHEE